MKKLLLIMLITTGATAGDLIYLNGFENTGLVSGTVSGLSSTGLEVKLSSSSMTETLAIDQNGGFVFSLQVMVGASWDLTVTTQPNNPTPQNCTITPASGVMPAGGDDTISIVCGNVQNNWDEMNWDQGQWQ
ncbi:hypothetical protein [Marinicella gelatinilytica]|uniref:hypothetical protein n=1 Tax=Marinicella gelatinilytica TaxID=2996017 RepID=UPI002260C6D8|nr:hypothetical protein [Marinicella gelatinilytica]MCX7545427.1 hypothetical protein [Marinicella gelatinilytica]